MKSATFDHIQSHTTPSDSARSNAVWAAFKQYVDGVRQARAEHTLRADLASLNDAVLRDIGIDADEIPRVRAHEDFTPRAWQ